MNWVDAVARAIVLSESSAILVCAAEKTGASSNEITIDGRASKLPGKSLRRRSWAVTRTRSSRRKLDVTEATVKVHVKAILRKVGAANRTQAAM